jgi:hypothetical protein
VVKFKIDLGLSFTVPDLVYKFQMVCLSYCVETKCKMYEQMYGHGKNLMLLDFELYHLFRFGVMLLFALAGSVSFVSYGPVLPLFYSILSK